jgi:hypothetical protein
VVLFWCCAVCLRAQELDAAAAELAPWISLLLQRLSNCYTLLTCGCGALLVLFYVPAPSGA